MIKAIETTFAGYRFRSRLEARWAVFFDSIGLPWEYEKEGYSLPGIGAYLPDFWLPYTPYYPNGGYFVEIKPAEPDYIEVSKLRALAAQTGHSSFLFAGVPGSQQIYMAHRSGMYFTPEYFGELPHEQDMTDDELCRHKLAGTFARWELDESVIERAIVAARSARFEHGEHP